jgi:hypothetical protein
MIESRQLATRCDASVPAPGRIVVFLDSPDSQAGEFPSVTSTRTPGPHPCRLVAMARVRPLLPRAPESFAQNECLVKTKGASGPLAGDATVCTAFPLRMPHHTGG